MNLYVWENVLKDYGYGKMFALASSVEEAGRLILAKIAQDEKAILDQFDMLLEDQEALHAYRFSEELYDIGQSNFDWKYSYLAEYAREIRDLLNVEPRVITVPEGFYVFGSA